MSSNGMIVGAAILIAGLMITKAIADGFRHVADRIDNNSRLLDRVGTKLDNLWSPLKGLSNAAWHKLGGPQKLSEMDTDNLE